MSDRSICCDVRDLDLAQFAPGGYSWLFWDPPWSWNDRRKIRKDGGKARFGIGTNRRYGDLTQTDLKAIPLPDLCADRCHVYLWACAPLLPQAFDLMGHWRTPRGAPVFKYATIAYVWVKLNKGLLAKCIKWWYRMPQAVVPLPQSGFLKVLERLTFFGPGFYTAANTEYVLLFRRGQPFRHGKKRKARQVILAPRLGDHSTKPEEAQLRAKWMYEHLPGEWLEMFARRKLSGWDVTGNDKALAEPAPKLAAVNP